MIVGERVREARELVGLTQGELAERIGLDRTAIAHIEAGRQQPRADAMRAIADLLGFPEPFFENDSTGEFPEGSLLFRARGSMTARERAQARRYGELIYRQTRPLFERLRIPPLTLPRLAETNPEMAAAHARAALGLSPDTPIRHLINAIERSGVLVLAIPLEIKRRDAYSLWVGEETLRPIIVVMGTPPGDRLRFSTAHEVGHLVMSHRQAAQMTEIEAQANEFAAFLLMSRHAALAEIHTPVTLGTLAQLKPRWGMSVQALVTHARRLDLVTARQQRYLYQQITQRGWRVREPANLDVPSEKPRAIRKVLEGAYGVPIDYRQAAADLRLKPHFLRHIVESFATRAELPRRAPDEASNVIPLRRMQPSSA